MPAYAHIGLWPKITSAMIRPYSGPLSSNSHKRKCKPVPDRFRNIKMQNEKLRSKSSWALAHQRIMKIGDQIPFVVSLSNHEQPIDRLRANGRNVIYAYLNNSESVFNQTGHIVPNAEPTR
jgi:hypothetical protein